MLEAFTYREDAAAVVGLLQLGRRVGGLSGASFGPVGVAHGEDGEGQVGLRQRWSCLVLMMGVLMRAEPGVTVGLSGVTGVPRRRVGVEAGAKQMTHHPSGCVIDSDYNRGCRYTTDTTGKQLYSPPLPVKASVKFVSKLSVSNRGVPIVIFDFYFGF